MHSLIGFKWYWTFLFISMIISSGFSQEQEEKHGEQHESRAVGSHGVFGGLGHTYLQKSKLENTSGGVAIATWNLAYSYSLSERWRIGLESELYLESFVIKSSEGDTIEREYPVAVAAIAIYEILPRVGVFGGFGYEIDPGETFRFTRIGAEYIIPMKNRWELAISGIWDYRIDIYSSWGVGIMLGKIWGGKPKPSLD